MLVALALSRVHLHGGQGRVMVLEDALDAAVLLLTLVDLEVFGAHIEVVLLALSEVETVGIHWLTIITSSANSGLLRGRGCLILIFFRDRKE